MQYTQAGHCCELESLSATASTEVSPVVIVLVVVLVVVLAAAAVVVTAAVLVAPMPVCESV